MAEAFFSIVIPTYNRGAVVRQAIDSVWAQSYRNFEIILVDDGSTDGGLSGLEQQQNARFKIISQSNRGVSSARNVGMENAKGNWIALLDADDLWTSGHLHELNRLIENYPEAGMVSSRIREVKGDKSHAAMHWSRPVKDSIVDYFLEAAKRMGTVHSSSVAIARRVFHEIGGFCDVPRGEDLEYWARVALDYPVACSNQTTALYVRGRGGVMETQEELESELETPTSMAMLSPSIKLLSERLSRNEVAPNQYPSVIRYINSHVSRGIRQRFARSDIAGVTDLGGLFLRPIARESRRDFILANLPPRIIRFLTSLRKTVRTAYRFVVTSFRPPK